MQNEPIPKISAHSEHGGFRKYSPGILSNEVSISASLSPRVLVNLGDVAARPPEVTLSDIHPRLSAFLGKPGENPGRRSCNRGDFLNHVHEPTKISHRCHQFCCGAGWEFSWLNGVSVWSNVRGALKDSARERVKLNERDNEMIFNKHLEFNKTYRT